uniref:Uncharacterized protein n=1 Tax=Rhizophora mucronata TaxID=61149 RepID=A0A2P2Q912_RHIMU
MSCSIFEKLSLSLFFLPIMGQLCFCFDLISLFYCLIGILLLMR